MNILAETTNNTVKQTTNVFQKMAHGFFNTHSWAVFLIAVTISLIIGRLVAHLLRELVTIISRRADQSPDLGTVNRLRRYETYIVLSTAIIRTALVLVAIYFWWIFVHPSTQPSAVIGASALVAILLSGTLAPVLRDLAFGSFMMAEQWYGVGDYIKVEPFADIEGVVERVTLRSTRVRALNGEIVWLSNQNISGVHVTPKGIRTIGLELFVTDSVAGEKLIESANKRLPLGPLLVITPLTVVSNEQVGNNLWHITAIGETAPGREWLIEKSAVEYIQTKDEHSKNPIISHGPLARFADREAEKSFRRTIENARKRPLPKRRVIKRPELKNNKTTHKTST